MHPILQLTTATALMLLATAASAQAPSCYDLWYERNQIYARNGFCFSTPLAKRTFANYECWTTAPTLTRAEERRVAAIRAEERRLDCKVNR